MEYEGSATMQPGLRKTFFNPILATYYQYSAGGIFPILVPATLSPVGQRGQVMDFRMYEDLRIQYEAKTVDQLEEALANFILTPEAELLCKKVINEKTGEEKYDIKEAEKLADAKSFIGGQLGGFIKVFMEDRRISWGWMALLFGPYWLAYRKMWLDAVLYAFLYTTPLGLVLLPIYTLFGKYRYYSKYVKIKAAAPISQPERAKFLAEKGGVSGLGTVGFFLIAVFAAILFAMIKHLLSQ